MSTAFHFPSELHRANRLGLGLAVAAAMAIATTCARPARADEMMLTGPHPFLRHNALTVQLLLGGGLNDSSNGRGGGIGYGYMLDGPLWLDLQVNVRAAACSPVTACSPTSGNVAEVLAGASWRFRTAVPIVPYLRAAGGMLYLYPRSAANAMGVVARGAIGLKYYVFDWLGFALEGALSLGHGSYDSDYRGSHTYAVFDAGVGVEWQFR